MQENNPRKAEAEEISKFINDSVTASEFSALLITGPPGSGKTYTVQKVLS